MQGYVFEVTDTGAGIPAESLEKIWEPFYTTGNHKGVSHNVGLGLAFVKNVMTQHHGTITIDSEVGRGTTFRLWVPALHSP
jgi:signal transduction histidine kinase